MRSVIIPTAHKLSVYLTPAKSQKSAFHTFRDDAPQKPLNAGKVVFKFLYTRTTEKYYFVEKSALTR